jgi:transposase InsO family protein
MANYWYSRKTICNALSSDLNTQLTLAVYRISIDQRYPAPGCIHHSDRSMKYSTKEYFKERKFNKLQLSISRKGNPFDNAYVESLMKTLKSEEMHL